MDPAEIDLSKVRHDLRGPINQIVGYCELLLEEPALPDGFAPDLRRIRTGGKQLLAVIGEYFDDATFAEHLRDPHRLHHDLRTPVNHIVGYCEMLEEQALESGHDQWVGDLRRIHGAARMWLELMEEHLLPVASGEPGDTRFALAAPAFYFHTVAPRSAEALGWTGRGNILVVDDDPGNRELLTRRLSRHGFHVRIAENGLDALHLLRASPCDLVLLDLVMPGIDGYQVLAKMKSDPALRHIPVVMISGLDQHNGIARCIEAGAEDYLTKPFDPVFLRARIGACLERKRRRDHEQATYQALVASQKALAAELAEAGAYVQSLLSTPLASGPVRAEWCFKPSTQLGGDSFGYHWVDDDHFAVYLLDVCGHGVGAALLAVSAVNVLRAGSIWAGNVDAPERILGALNRMFPMAAQNHHYFTLWLGIFSRSTRRLAYASAGHPPAVLFAPGATHAELRTPGPPIGAVADARFAADSVAIPVDGVLFVLSDGTYEVERPGGEPGTFAEFVARLARESARPGYHPRETLESLRAHARDGRIEDDFSLVRLVFPDDPADTGASI